MTLSSGPSLVHVLPSDAAMRCRHVCVLCKNGALDSTCLPVLLVHAHQACVLVFQGVLLCNVFWAGLLANAMAGVCFLVLQAGCLAGLTITCPVFGTAGICFITFHR